MLRTIASLTLLLCLLGASNLATAQTSPVIQANTRTVFSLTLGDDAYANDTAYRALGRADLAEKYTNRASLKRGFSLGGAALVGMGAVGVLMGGFLYVIPPGGKSTGQSVLLGSGALLLAGGGLIAGGILMSPQPLSVEERLRLIDGRVAQRVRGDVVNEAGLL